MANHRGADYKDTAVHHYLRTNNQLETCRIFECTPRSLMRWVERYNRTGTTNRENRLPMAYKVETKHVQYLLKELKENPTIPIADLHALLQKEYPSLDISRVHVGRIVRDNNQTLKRTRVRHEPKERYGKPIDINAQLREFYNTVKKYNIDDMISIDETSLGSFMVRKYCRTKIGKRCVLKTHTQEVFKKHTGIFAINTTGCVGFHVYESGGIDSKRLIEFLEQQVLQNEKGKIVVLDNASSHRNPEVKKLVLKNNNLLYSVPYQHFTNPIENFFSVLKSHIQKERPIGRDAILETITSSLRKIPKSQYRNFFKNAFERDKALPKEKKPSTRERSPKKYKKSAF